MRILVAGAGATGGFFGGRLAEAGRDVTFLVREGRATVLAERGLRIRSPGGETRLTPRVITRVDRHYDLVVVAVKSYALDAVVAGLGAAIGPRTVVVPLLNGMRHVPTLITAFGVEHVWGGLCMIHATTDEHGDVVQMTGLARLVCGPLDGGPDDRMDAVAAAIGEAGFDARTSRHIRAEMWEKWVLLATLGAATTLMRGSIGAINAAPGGPEVNRAIADEAIAVATAAGFPPRPQAREIVHTTIGSSEPTTSSLYRDLVAGRPVEGDAIVGDLVAEGRRHGVRTPLLAAAHTGLAVHSASVS
ncbi:2-dehydropantoate 2-reductase [Actinoplanes sp. SE50]|uniref:ketopantoate reductase family protein n=1 Tax=unclassified Actinoplanes TaxID=2626549 RepID=UPI00023EC185|nr:MULTISPECIES: ketopantoate reductase family protein [unclassified Actinoplanes]AEV87508.1 2-dehydropantoate 2-reductase [Actinoplanes sp. SE50/110]ATO85911.1 2-dehydropantoate 2-reductase [Actinoplanes sp. SE50]SLM03325.1 2-dehydropantoate 2-reductase [Actinoplanes sp. SE50/110]